MPKDENDFPKSIKSIKTQAGHNLMKALEENGWMLKSEYKNFVDKGIDYDFYIFQKGKSKVKLEWDNWSEWQVLGNERVLEEIELKYL